jgi:hypothetical protein
MSEAVFMKPSISGYSSPLLKRRTSDPVHGGYGWESPTPRKRSNRQTKKLKSGYGPHHGYLVKGPAPRRTDRQTVGRNVTWNWTCVIALQITEPSSRRRGRRTWKIRKVIVTQINVTSGHLLQKGRTPRRNGRLTVGRNVTSTSVYASLC